MKLSIIVPVYNMADHGKLEFCLNSLVNQTISDYEIIAVDDCSTDNSFDILKNYEARYPHKFIALKNSENLHQGGGKNTGLRAAKGEWISFIDADDWVVPDYYERMFALAHSTGADVVGCDYCLVSSHTFEATDRIPNNKLSQTGILDDEKRKSLILDGGSLCTKIFKRQRILDSNLFFPEHIFYEDNAVGNSYMILANHFEYIPEPLYFYYQHQSSTVHTFSVDRCEDRRTAGKLMIDEARRLNYYEKYKSELEYAFTLLHYQNTLFTYMAQVKPAKISYVRTLSLEIKDYFPDFESNTYYMERTNPEERKLLHMALKSPLAFYIYYRLLWGYRNFIGYFKKL